jgi:hypothetical protein
MATAASAESIAAELSQLAFEREYIFKESAEVKATRLRKAVNERLLPAVEQLPQSSAAERARALFLRGAASVV